MPFFPRITRAYRVQSDFHARYQAISRTYVYRFALGLRHHTEMPVTERDLCWALRDTWVPPPLFCTCSEGFCLKPHHYARVTEAKSSQRGIGTSSGKSCTWIIHTHKQDPSQGQANDYRLSRPTLKPKNADEESMHCFSSACLRCLFEAHVGARGSSPRVTREH